MMLRNLRKTPGVQLVYDKGWIAVSVYFWSPIGKLGSGLNNPRKETTDDHPSSTHPSSNATLPASPRPSSHRQAEGGDRASEAGERPEAERVGVR